MLQSTSLMVVGSHEGSAPGVLQLAPWGKSNEAWYCTFARRSRLQPKHCGQPPWVNVTTPLHQGNLETGLTFLARNKRQLESSKIT
jgi:hypothetical protein